MAMAKRSSYKLSPEQEAKWNRRGNSFWSIFLFTKDGKIKSTLLIYSFSFSVLCLAIYFVAYLLMLDGLDSILAGKMSTWLVNLIESLAPALVGTLFCNVFHFPIKDKRIIPAAYIWLILFGVGMTIAIVLGMPADERILAFSFLMMVVPAPILTGTAFSFFLFFRHRKKHPDLPNPEDIPIWKRIR